MTPKRRGRSDERLDARRSITAMMKVVMIRIEMVDDRSGTTRVVGFVEIMKSLCDLRPSVLSQRDWEGAPDFRPRPYYAWKVQGRRNIGVHNSRQPQHSHHQPIILLHSPTLSPPPSSAILCGSLL